MRFRPSYANVMSTVAVFIALGGVSYAVVRLPAGSVGTKQLKSGAVTRAKISPSTLSGMRGAQGPQGVQGPAGPAGPSGPAGSDAIPAVQTVTGSGTAGQFSGYGSALCPSGMKAVGGGYAFTNTNLVVIESGPGPGGGYWIVDARNPSGTGSGVYTVKAVCATAR